MTPDRWARVSEVFSEALERSGAERTEFLRRACEADDGLRDEVLRLLQAHDRPGALVDESIVPGGMLAEAAAGRMFREGQMVNGRFRITRFLGEGGMGEVYAAEDQELRSPVAIKTLHPNLAGSSKFAERFRQEIQMARQVTHPNVCRIFDAGRHAGTLYLTMELLDGETLARRLGRDGRIPPLEALPIVRQLCAGLSAAHRAGILHRDFKSGNVMLAGPRAVITDFGLARLLEMDGSGGATTGIAIGTPAYMAPEQIEGRPVGSAADIYALGVVMYEMATGRRPYEESSPLALAARKAKETPPRPREFAAGITPAWESAILKCLAGRPEDRFADAQQVAAAVDGSALVAVPWRLPRKKLGMAAAVAAILLAGSFGIKTLIDRGRPHGPLAEAVRWYRQGMDAMAEGAFLKASNLLERAVSLDDRYIAAHARLAEAYAELDIGDKAKDEVIHAATLAPDRSKLPAEDAQLLDAAQFTVGREFEKAERTYRAIAQSAHTREPGRAWIDLGRAAEKANLTEKAIDAYQRAAVSSPQREVALLHLGILNARKGNAPQAAAQLAEAGQLFQLASNYEGVTETKLAFARMYESSNLAQAEAQARSAIEMTGLTGNLQQQVKSRLELSRIKLLQGHADEAEAVTNETLALADRNHLDNLSVQGLNDITAFLSRELRWKDVEVYSRRTIELAKRSKSRAGEARALIFLAQARMQLNDNEGALQYLSQAEPFYRAGDYSELLQLVLALEAEVLCNQGRYAEAKKYADELRKWGETRSDVVILILGLQCATEPLAFEGDYAAALDLLQHEADLEKQSGREAGTAYALINQGDMLWRLGRYSDSAARLDDARSILSRLRKGAPAPAQRLDTIQAESLLSQLRLNPARVKAEAALRSAEGGTALRIIEPQAVLALALVRLGQTSAGRAMCAKLLRTAETAGVPAGISIARVAFAEAAWLANDSQAELLAKEARDHCLRYGHRELALRALLIQWNVEQRAGAARAAQESAMAFDRDSKEFEKSWGAGSLALYLQRPDIRSLIPPKR